MDDNGWLPMETAPRDGTEFLIYVPPHERYGTPAVMAVVYWEGGGGWPWRLANDEENWTSWPEQAPTHWRPLPPAPAEQPNTDAPAR